MTVDQVFQLLDKGFTRDDIMNLTENDVVKDAQPEQTEPVPQETPTEPVPQETPTQPEQKPVTQPENKEQDQTGKRLDSIEQSISKLINAIQLQNLRNDSFGSSGETLEEKTDKIMASIIRPEKKG